MASRYRLSIERPINRTAPKLQAEAKTLVSYDCSPEPENTTDISNDIEFLQARLRSKSQIEHQLRRKLSDAHANTTSWRHRYQYQANRANQYQEEMSNLRKRHTEEIAELNRELRWNHKKVKSLERVINENHQARSSRTVEPTDDIKQLMEANERLIHENARLSEQVRLLTLDREEHARRHEQLINELEQLKQAREGDFIDIQNLENAVKALHDENQILKETPIPVVLPKSQPGQNELGQNLFQYQSSRPTQPCVSLIVQRAQEKRREAVVQPSVSGIPNAMAQERWPYGSSDEDDPESL